uniref:NADH-ubiquinone oxidoreductase chain 2 n=1 Tax=Nesomachilis australica TaxID=299218 RepID=Q5C853_9INSE|nr:NADH dehydrogenase subunit 2 [Nesomachilis australica]AAV50263.1 NADH dehydrogenase subunit 2 [Nesomachilis australica]
MLFFSTLMSGTLISVSSGSWFGAWMGLEMNLLSFTPIMSNKTNQRSTEAALKYFLIQVLGSIILLLGATILSLSNFNFFFYSNHLPYIVITSALLLKMGAAPLHFWFPVVMEGLPWVTNIILMTWQKIAPLVLISYYLNLFPLLLFTFVAFSALLGSIGGLNQTSLRKIMAYSSISHMSWMLASMSISENLWFSYYLMYSMLSMTVAIVLLNMNIFHINQIHNAWKTWPMNKMMLSLNLLSLGGLPPFLGFLPKFMVLQNMMYEVSVLVPIILMFSALITLSFYLRIIFSALMIFFSVQKYTMPKYQKKTMNKMSTSIISTITIFSLPIIPLIFWMT